MAPPRRENLVFASMLGHESSLLEMWEGDSWECDGKRWDSLFWCLHQYAERTHGSVDHFILTRIQQKSCFSMTVPGRTQVRRSHYILLLDSVTSFTLLQRSSTLSLLQGCLEPWKRLSTTWSLEKMMMWMAHLELGYLNRTKCFKFQVSIYFILLTAICIGYIHHFLYCT